MLFTVDIEELEKDLETERERLYLIVNQLGLSAKLAIKQSHVLDELIVLDLINQSEKITAKKESGFNLGAHYSPVNSIARG